MLAGFYTTLAKDVFGQLLISVISIRNYTEQLQCYFGVTINVA